MIHQRSDSLDKLCPTTVPRIRSSTPSSLLEFLNVPDFWSPGFIPSLGYGYTGPRTSLTVFIIFAYFIASIESLQLALEMTLY